MWKIRLYKFFMTICFSFPEFSSSRNISVKILPIQQIISKTFLFNYPFLFDHNFIHLYVCLCNLISFLIYFLSVLPFFLLQPFLFYFDSPALSYCWSQEFRQNIKDVRSTWDRTSCWTTNYFFIRCPQTWMTDRQTDTLKKFWTCQYKKIETKFGLTTDKLHFGAFNELYKRWRTQNDIGCYTKFCSPIWNVWPKVYMKNR